MQINEAQREVRVHFVGGFYGQLVSGLLWLVSAGLATWGSPRAAIAELVVGGFFIFPAIEAILRVAQGRVAMSADNALRSLGMQVAFVLPFSMPLLLPVTQHRLNLFYPAMMILLGAHYIPFVFMYGMRMFAALAAALVGGGVVLALHGPDYFSTGAWYSAVVLLLFAAGGKAIVQQELRADTGQVRC